MNNRILIVLLAGVSAAGGLRADPPLAAVPAGFQTVFDSVAEVIRLADSRHAVYEPDALRSNVIAALVSALDPQGGAVLDADEARRRADEDNGRFYGIGCTVDLARGHVRVQGVLSNSPAAAAGMQPSNLIVRIDGHDTAGMSLEDVVNRHLRGRPGAPIKLELREPGSTGDTRTVTLQRAMIQEPVTGTQETWPQGVGYLAVNGLFTNSGAVIAAQVSAWRDTSSVAGVILDLRGAGGTDMESVAAVGSLFARAGDTLLTLQDGRGQPVAIYKAEALQPLAKPVMVLVDRDTRGAAEALAALLQGTRGAMVIGEPTRGDGRVREVIPLADGRVLYLATRRVALSRAPDYHGTGVEPQVRVADVEPTAPAADDAQETETPDLFSESSDQERQDRALNQRIGADAVLRRAADILLGLKALNISVR